MTLLAKLLVSCSWLCSVDGVFDVVGLLGPVVCPVCSDLGRGLVAMAGAMAWVGVGR